MQHNKNCYSPNKGLKNDFLEEKLMINKKKINLLKIEFQEPKEETMHLLSPNKSDRKILDDDIYKTEMNNKKPIDIFQDISIDNLENNKNDEIKKSKNDLQYLIEKNKTERIDFISTLLRLKGIKIDEDKNYDKKEKSELNMQVINNTNNTNSIGGGQTNLSTNISKINSENKLINNDSLNEENSNIRKCNKNKNINESDNQSYNDNKNNILKYVINHNKINTINNSKRLIRFCSSMIRNKKKSKLYYSSKSTNKKNKYINFDYEERKINHFLNIFNKVTIQNNNIIINNINEKDQINYIQNINDKKFDTLCHNKSNLIKKIPINNIKNNKYNKKENNSNNCSSKCKKTKICFEETIPHPKFNKSNHRHNSAFYKNRTKPIIQIEKNKIGKNIKNLSNISNNSINVRGKIKHLRSFSQTKYKPIKNYINIIKKNFSSSINNLNDKIIDLKHNNNIFLKKQFYIKEKIKNEDGLFTTKSNLLKFRNDFDFANIFRFKLKEIKKIMKENESKLIRSSKRNNNLYESILKKNKEQRRNENEILNKNNDYNFDIVNNKEKSKDYINIEIKDNINKTDFINNEKKNIILSIEINRKCFS